MGRWGYRISIRYLTSESPYLHVLIYCILFRPKGVDIVGGDINGLSTRIHDENEANVQFLKQDQNARYVMASCFFVSFFFCCSFTTAESLTSPHEWKHMLCLTGRRFSQRQSNDPSL